MPSAQPFAGKVALITGAAGGIGRASAFALAAAGADIALNDVQSTDAQAAEVQSLGRRAVSLPVDVTDQAAVDAMIDRVLAELGPIELLVLAHVYSDREPFTIANMTGFRRTIDVSLWGGFYVLRSVANQMIRQGRGGAVAVVSSPHSVVSFPNCMAYNMAKSAQDAMARTAAIELLPYKIRVNVVHPGWTDTPGERKFFSEENLAQAGPTLPAGRLARPEEVARGIAFLLDPASEYINGTTLSIDGGLSLPWWSKRGSGTL